MRNEASHIDALEPRRMFAAYPFDLDLSTLTIRGNSATTASLNNYSLEVAGGRLYCKVNGVHANYDASKILKIRIFGHDGKDLINIKDSVKIKTEVYAQGGNDSIKTGGGNDVIYAGAGNDTIDAGLGNDDISGDAGYDTVSYATRTKPLKISVDDSRNDGQTGEYDNVRISVEAVIGGFGNDVITSPDHLDINNYFEGGSGADSLNGGGGSDILRAGINGKSIFADTGARDSLRGGTGNDKLYASYYRSADMAGGQGNDALYGSNVGDSMLGGDGDDRLEGNGGPDTLIGGTGRDTMRGGSGNDIFFARDNTRDTLDGGSGYDVAQLDKSGSNADLRPLIEIFS